MYYKCHERNPNRGGSYVDSIDRTKNKKATINQSIKKIKNVFKTL